MNEPQRAADLLGGILKQAGATPQRVRLCRAVEEAVGPERSASVSVRGFRAGNLVLEVDNAPLFAELRAFASESLRQRINEALGKDEVAKISFRLGGSGHT